MSYKYTTQNITGKDFQLTDHLVVLHTVFTAKHNGRQPQVVALNDYHPRCMDMPCRGFTNENYKFGFNGKEMDNEVKGTGNMINYKYRVHDVRIGRFLSIDPLAPKYPHNSPYAFSENRVIDGVELEGLEVVLMNINARLGCLLTVSSADGVAIDREGIALYASLGGGGFYGIYAGIGWGVSVFPTGSIERIKEWGTSVGVTTPVGEFTYDTSWDDNPAVGGTGGLGFKNLGVGPGGALLEQTYTIATRTLTWYEIGESIYETLPHEQRVNTSPEVIAEVYFNKFKDIADEMLDNPIDNVNNQIATSLSSVDHYSQMADFYQQRASSLKSEGKPKYKYQQQLDLVEYYNGLADKEKESVSSYKKDLSNLRESKKTLKAMEISR